MPVSEHRPSRYRPLTKELSARSPIDKYTARLRRNSLQRRALRRRKWRNTGGFANPAGDLGVSLGFNIQQLPVFSLWKNTDTMEQGYVTGLDPAPAGPPTAAISVHESRATIGPKEERHFDITYTFLADKSAVESALQQVQKIQNNRPTEVRKSPLVELPNN